MRADPTAIAHAATALLDAAHRLNDRLRQESTADIGGDVGRLPAAAELATAHRRVVEHAGQIVAELRDVLDGDADRLLRIAFALADADRHSGRRLGSAVPGSSGPAPLGGGR